MSVFENEINIRWADCDPNRHVRHSAYYDFGAHNRIRYFAEIGFGSETMNELKIGPILFKEECTFIKEISIDDTIRICLFKGDITEDGRKWVLHHEIFNSKNDKCAHITVFGAWLNLDVRKLTVPPQKLADGLQRLHPGSHYTYKKDQNK